MKTKFINPKQFSKDHWSLLAYIESRVHNYKVAPFTGELNKDHLRINPNGDYGVLATPIRFTHERTWKEDYGTRLWGYWGKGEKIDYSKRLPQHDDVNCLIDFEESKFIEIISLVNFYIKFTKKGQRIASELREWKNAGNAFYNFKPSAKEKSTA